MDYLDKLLTGELYLFEVPKEFRTYAICEVGVAVEGSFLSIVPDEVKDYRLCKTALENGGSFYDVPKRFRSRELCIMAHLNEDIYKIIPTSFKTYEFLCKLLEIRYDFKVLQDIRKLLIKKLYIQ